MKAKRLQLSAKTFSLYNQRIHSQVLHHPQIQEAKTIGCYVSLPSEVDTIPIIDSLLPYKRICVPKVDGDHMQFYEISSLSELKPGHFRVLEPVTTKKIMPHEIDCMIVPLLAYDQLGYRVGYGKGYYDRYFQSDFYGYKIGLAFSFQYVDYIYHDVFDQKLDEVINEIP